MGVGFTGKTHDSAKLLCPLRQKVAMRSGHQLENGGAMA